MAHIKGLSALYFTVLHLVDEGQVVTIAELDSHIERGDALAWIEQLAGGWEQQRQLLRLALDDAQSVADLEAFLTDWRSAEPSAFAVSNNGLVLLLGWAFDALVNGGSS